MGFYVFRMSLNKSFKCRISLVILTGVVLTACEVVVDAGILPVLLGKGGQLLQCNRITKVKMS